MSDLVPKLEIFKISKHFYCLIEKNWLKPDVKICYTFLFFENVLSKIHSKKNFKKVIKLWSFYVIGYTEMCINFLGYYPKPKTRFTFPNSLQT